MERARFGVTLRVLKTPAAPRAWPAPDHSPLDTPVNLPNAITLGRIALTPLIAWLPFTTSWTVRLIAFLLFTIAAVTDYWDGHLARSRNLVTDLGRLLDHLTLERAFGRLPGDGEPQATALALAAAERWWAQKSAGGSDGRRD